MIKLWKQRNKKYLLSLGPTTACLLLAGEQNNVTLFKKLQLVPWPIQVVPKVPCYTDIYEVQIQ